MMMMIREQLEDLVQKALYNMDAEAYHRLVAELNQLITTEYK
jgi:hypothetical protein